MVYDLDEDIERFTAMRDELQTEIDALTDQHRAICRAIAALQGQPDAVPDGWVPAPAVQLVPTPPASKPERSLSLAPQPTTLTAGKKPAKKTGGRKSTAHDYLAIAKWINEHRAAGTYSRAALAKEFRVPQTTAQNFPTVCRNLGLLEDQPATASTPPLLPSTTASSTPGYVTLDAVAAAEAATS